MKDDTGASGATTCSSSESIEQIRKEREYFKGEYNRLVSENEDLRQLVIKIEFSRYGFGK